MAPEELEPYARSLYQRKCPLDIPAQAERKGFLSPHVALHSSLLRTQTLLFYPHGPLNEIAFWTQPDDYNALLQNVFERDTHDSHLCQ